MLGEGHALEYVLFWGHTSKADRLGKECLSQWFPARFVADGVELATAEHYMMYRKALLFGDRASAEEILSAGDPGKVKALGRAVRGFDKARWEAERSAIVVAGNVAKFSQNPALRAYLLGTGAAVLVEASPSDGIWGIGLAESDPRARQPSRWPGLNLLGFALMEARRILGAAGAAAR
jgi:hypothetical protein